MNFICIIHCFENEINIYNEDNDIIEKFDNFFGDLKKIDLHEKENNLYQLIKSSGKKLSLKTTKNNLLYPIENYYQSNKDKIIHITNLAKYEFNPLMLEMSTGIKNIGLAFWNYKNIPKDKKFDNLLIKLNGNIEYFQENKIIENKPSIFSKSNPKGIHSLLFLLSEEENKIDDKKKNFLQRKRKNNELYYGNFSELI